MYLSSFQQHTERQHVIVGAQQRLPRGKFPQLQSAFKRGRRRRDGARRHAHFEDAEAAHHAAGERGSLTMGRSRELWTAIATSQPRVQIQTSLGNAFVKLRELPTNMRRLI